MQAWLSDALVRLGADPLLQAMLAAVATFIFEDPTTIGCGLLVADGRMAFRTAFAGVAVGIAIGDVVLYATGRLFAVWIVRWGWIPQKYLDRGTAWFQRHVVSTVLLSRFLPGTRLVTYLAAGVLRAPFAKYVLVVIGASVAWTAFLLWVTASLGAAILPLLGKAKWPLAIVAVATFTLLQRRAARKRAAARAGSRPVASAFEFWPPWLFYIPVAFYYLWLSLRYRGPMLPTVANPSIFSGGVIGESKSQILDLVPERWREWLAPYVLFRRPTGGDGARDVEHAKRAIHDAALSYPLVAKPDIGQRGAGVRPLREAAELAEYVRDFPTGGGILFQRLVGEEATESGAAESPDLDARLHGVREAGVMYWRAPGADRGNISSITLKQTPRIVGDGHSTVSELIRSDRRARRVAGVYLKRHAGIAGRVLPAGEKMPLVFSGNHCQGAIFRDGTDLVTPRLSERVHEIARAIPEFYFGRFDIRFDDPGAFLRGEGFRIIEINGAGAEATHIWDASARLSDAYATLFRQFRILFEIGAANRHRGHRPLGVVRFLREAAAYRRLARSYPLTH